MGNGKEEERTTKLKAWYHSQDYKARKQTAKRVNQLLQKQSKLLGSYQKLAPFKEPVLFLIRRGGMVEFYENVKEAAFMVPNNPDAESKAIYLNERKLLTFKYGKHSFKGYIAYEDDMFPLPNMPQVDARLGKAIIDKLLVNYERLKASAERVKWQGLRGVLIGLAVIIGIIGLVVWVTGMSFTEIIGIGGDAVAQGAEAAATTPSAPVPDTTVVVENGTTVIREFY